MDTTAAAAAAITPTDIAQAVALILALAWIIWTAPTRHDRSE